MVKVKNWQFQEINTNPKGKDTHKLINVQKIKKKIKKQEH